MKSNRNRLANTANKYQNFKEYPTLLAVCSAGMLRSPTAAFVLSKDPFNFNTRACGIEEEYALILVDDTLVTWADIIIVMSVHQKVKLLELMDEWDIPAESKKIFNFGIPDRYDYRDSELIQLIEETAKEKLHSQYLNK